MLKWLLEICDWLFFVEPKKEPRRPELMKHAKISIKYLPNDPTTPKLTTRVPIPPPLGALKYTVKGFQGETPKNVVQAQAASCYVTLNNSISFFQRIVGKNRQPPKKWPGTRCLSVFPRAGKNLNAYYNRSSLRFFYDRDPKTKKMVYTADSTDVVAHELGHAILDAMRPDFWNVQALEIWAFHEAFADINAILAALQFDIVLNYVLKETNNNLRIENVVSKIAEEIGLSIYHNVGGKGTPKHIFLRTANNRFKYVNPSKLPKEAPPNKLSRECHSFGRVFLGAWYAIFCEIHKREMERGKSPKQALKMARNTMAEYTFKAIFNAPRQPRFHAAVANAMMAADRAKGAPYQDILAAIFRVRKLVRGPKIKVLSAHQKTIDDVFENLKVDDFVMKRGEITTVTIRNSKIIKLSDHLPKKEMTMMSTGINLDNVEVEIATDSYYEFDKKGIITMQSLPDETEAIEAAALCLEQINCEGRIEMPGMKTLVADPFSQPPIWKVANNKLKRIMVE